MEAEFDELAAEDDFAAAVENSEDLPEKEDGLDESEEDDEESSASALAISAVLALVLIVV